MTKITNKRITYKELKDGTYKNAYIPQDDKFPVTCHLTTGLRDAMITCPSNKDDSKTFMHVFLDQGKEVGRAYYFGTRFKGGDKVYYAQTSFGLEVIEEYRSEGVGAELVLFPLTNNEYDFVLFAGIALKVLPLYRKLKYHLFEVPQYYKVKHARYVFRSLRPSSWLALGRYIVQKCKDIPYRIKSSRLKKKFIIQKELIIPEWVTEMVANEGHKYMEIHDKEWFQWSLDHETHGYKEDINTFYSIRSKDNKPMAFFMTKERTIKKTGPNNGIVIGTVVEWESIDKSILSEAYINLLAIQSFSKKVDVIYTLACESDTADQLINMGFHERASFKIGIKDKKKLLEDIGDKNLWRLRYGYTSMVFSS